MKHIELLIFMGFPVEFIWLPILLGMAVGFTIPLKPIIRKKLHFCSERDFIINEQRDYEALNKKLPGTSKDEIIKFNKLLRILGLTLYIEK